MKNYPHILSYLALSLLAACGGGGGGGSPSTASSDTNQPKIECNAECQAGREAERKAAEEAEKAKVEAEEDVKAGRKPKPEAVLEKMVAGRIEKFYKENCLLEQVFIKDGEKTVQAMINEAIAKIGENINVRRYVRYALGEGIEKKQDDFVAEVMATVGK